jgi:hypothetical protein
MPKKQETQTLPGHEAIHVRLEGTPPGLQMDNGDRADPLDKLAQLVDGLRKGTPTNKRTYKYHQNLAYAGLIAALWTNELPEVMQSQDDDIQGVKGDAFLVIPGNALMSMLSAALARQRRGGGGDAKIALSFDEYYPLMVNGKMMTAREVFEHYDDYAKRVRIRNKRGEWITATRPLFREWSCEIRFEYQLKLFDRDKVFKALGYAGDTLGLGTSRSRGHGRFEVEMV